MDRVYVMELVRSFQVGELSRRQFLVRATAALGSAATATLLLSACTPVTGPTEPVLVEPETSRLFIEAVRTLLNTTTTEITVWHSADLIHSPYPRP